jgi:hypothetical protein
VENPGINGCDVSWLTHFHFRRDAVTKRRILQAQNSLPEIRETDTGSSINRLLANGLRRVSVVVGARINDTDQK